MPDSGSLNFKTRCHTFISVSLTLWCLSLLLGDTSLPCAYWMNTNVLIKPWWRSTLQSSLKICTKLEGGGKKKAGRCRSVKRRSMSLSKAHSKRLPQTSFLLKGPQMKSALISPPLTWVAAVFWEVKGQWEQSGFKSIKRLLTELWQSERLHSSSVPTPPSPWVRKSGKDSDFFH